MIGRRQLPRGFSIFLTVYVSLVQVSAAVALEITSFSSGILAWTNALVPGVCTVEAAVVANGN